MKGLPDIKVWKWIYCKARESRTIKWFPGCAEEISEIPFKIDPTYGGSYFWGWRYRSRLPKRGRARSLQIRTKLWVRSPYSAADHHRPTTTQMLKTLRAYHVY